VWILTQQVKTDHNFCICQILDTKWVCSKVVRQIFVDFIEGL